jgi:hypothetical protein
MKVTPTKRVILRVEGKKLRSSPMSNITEGRGE